MRKLKEETAIRLTLKMWRWLAKTGQPDKEYYFRDSDRKVLPAHVCFLCEYAKQQDGMSNRKCPACPYYQQYGRCVPGRVSDKNTAYTHWVKAGTPTSRKAWAKKCVEQLEALREK